MDERPRGSPTETHTPQTTAQCHKAALATLHASCLPPQLVAMNTGR